MADFKVTPLEPTLDFDHLPYWDVVIIGAGPAGLAASLTTAHRALTTLVIEAKDNARRAAAVSVCRQADRRHPRLSRRHHRRGAVRAARIARRSTRSCSSASTRSWSRSTTPTRVETDDPLKRVVTSARQLPVPQGDHRLRAAALSRGGCRCSTRSTRRTCTTRSPRSATTKGSRVAVVGGGDSALDAALMVLGRSGAGRPARARGDADRQSRTRWRASATPAAVIHTVDRNRGGRVRRAS